MRMRRSDPWESQQMVLQKQREGSFRKVGNISRTTPWEKSRKVRIIMRLLNLQTNRSFSSYLVQSVQCWFLGLLMLMRIWWKENCFLFILVTSSCMPLHYNILGWCSSWISIEPSLKASLFDWTIPTGRTKTFLQKLSHLTTKWMTFLFVTIPFP